MTDFHSRQEARVIAGIVFTFAIWVLALAVALFVYVTLKGWG